MGMRYWMVSSQRSKQSNNKKTKSREKEKNTTHEGLVKRMVPPSNSLWPPRRSFFREIAKESGFGMDKREDDM